MGAGNIDWPAEFSHGNATEKELHHLLGFRARDVSGHSRALGLALYRLHNIIDEPRSNRIDGNARASMRCHSSGEISRKSLIWAMPALFTRIEIGPNFLRASVTRASTSFFFATSARKAIAFLRRDDPLISSATASARRWLISATTTRAPSWANNCAVALPSPEPAPVTNAIFLLSRI